MTLKLNGYSTAQFGKCHEVPVWQSSPMGPFDAWPSGGGGFETFYGFIGGENNQYDPALYDGTTPVEPPATAEEGYHLTEDLADRACRLDAPAEGADAGQAVLRLLRARAPRTRRTTCRRSGPTGTPASSTTAGTCSASAPSPGRRSSASSRRTPSSPPRHDEITAWDDMPDELKPVLARQMEVYAGFLEHTDHHVGRLIDAIDDLGVLDDTIIYYIIGDNGASAEGTMNGAFNEMANFNGMAALETPEFMLSKMDELGWPDSYNHYSVGWAWAMNTPAAVDEAGRLALGRHPQRHDRALAGRASTEAGGLRSQFTHVIDVAPTDPRGGRSARADHGQRRAAVADRGHQHALHLQRARMRRSVTTCSTSRCSATEASTTRAGVPSPSTRRPGSWSAATLPAFDDDVWELYDGNNDFSQARNLAAEHPDKLAKLQRLWLIEATKYNVLPLDDRTGERLNPELAGRPTLIRGNSQMFFAGHGPALGEQRGQHQEQVVLGDRRGRGSGGRRRTA